MAGRQRERFWSWSRRTPSRRHVPPVAGQWGDVWALIDPTVTHHERAYDNLPAHERLTTHVRLTLNDGATQVAKVVHPRGTGDRNLTNASIRDKYAKPTHDAVSADPQARARAC